MIDYREVNGRIDKFQILKRSTLFSLFEDNKLHIRQLPVLEYIIKNDGCSQNELAEFLCVSPASIAVSTKRMQKAGYLEKKEDENNLRKKNLYVTELGKETVAKCRKIFDSFYEKVYSGISDDDLNTFCNVIDRMTINITGESQNNIDPEELLRLKPRHHHCEKFNDCIDFYDKEDNDK